MTKKKILSILTAAIKDYQATFPPEGSDYDGCTCSCCCSDDPKSDVIRAVYKILDS